METQQQRKITKKVLSGVVVSDKMNKTAVVRFEELKKHPIYKKYYRRSKKYKIHDERNECRIGDQVRIVECRPMSKEKYFRLLEILKSKQG